MSYVYDAQKLEQYMQYVIKSYKKTLIDGLYNMVIVDCENITLHYCIEFHEMAKACGYTVHHFLFIYTRI